MKQNFLKLNDEKTDYILIGSRQHLGKLPPNCLTIGESKIDPTSHVKNLGIVMDASMTMENHISKITSTSSFHLRNIRSIRKYINKSAAEQLVHSFITSRLDLGNSLLYGLPQKHLHRLQLIQNTAARVITKTPKFAHITNILKDLHWLPLNLRIIYKILLIVFKFKNHVVPDYIADMLTWHAPKRNLRSRDKLLLHQPKSRTSWGDRAFSVAAPRLWNNLPLTIRSCVSLNSFKTSLKSHLLKEAYPTIEGK